MLTLNDGRSELWQWDTGRTLAVDADCSQVHFSNKVFGRSIDVDVVDGSAIIPDILLQTDNDLNVWAFVGTAENGYTKISKTFKVNRRNKPADYVFTQTDQMTLQTIQSQIGDLADLTTEAKDTLVAAINEAARTGGGAGSMDLRVADGYIQYSMDGGSTWKNLIAVAELKGDKGDKGDTGPAGATGPQGPKGDTGATGPQGPQGPKGDKGGKGDKGADGKTAYQYAQGGGYTGTEADFAAKLASVALIVHVTGVNDNLSADKTYADIMDAILAGTTVLVDRGELYLPLVSINTEYPFLVFGTTICVNDDTGKMVYESRIEITQNDEVKDISTIVDIPTTLPNPNALTFTGAVTGSYDGSAPLSVEIPSGGADCTIAVDILASGTVAQGSEEPVDTGITLGKLKEYKMFILSVSGASNVNLHNWYTKIGNLSISRVNNVRGQTILYEFLNAEKTVLIPRIGTQGNHSVYNRFNGDISSYGVGQTAAFPECIYNLAVLNDNTTVITYPVKSETVDVNWAILGVVK